VQARCQRRASEQEGIDQVDQTPCGALVSWLIGAKQALDRESIFR
jgi:hypothetical protein